MSDPVVPWADLLGQLEDPAVGQVAETLADATDVSVSTAYDQVEAALDAGQLVEDTDASAWGVVRPAAGAETLANDETAPAGPAEEATDPRGSGGKTAEDGPQESAEVENSALAWREADFTAPRAGEWPAELLDRESWMGQPAGGKSAFAPWGDRDAPAPCSTDGCEADTAADCNHDARWKWGYTGNYADGHTARKWADMHPRLGGQVFIQREDDPYAFVDGDDVRCPETGGVHPGFIDILERLGITYADVSTSGGGVHANYRGELPDGVKQAVFEIDGEAWGAHDEDDVPTVEIYDGKHVCVATGEHVPGTPLEVNPWDQDAVADVLDEYGELPDPVDPAEEREAFDAEEYDAGATESDETTDDIRDVFAALDRLDARDVAAKTIVREWLDPPGTDDRAFAPVWAPSGYKGTANFANERAWTDSGSHGGYGGPVALAAIDCPDLQHIDETDVPGAPTGADWFVAVDHLRDLGFRVPKYVGGGDAAGEEYAPDPRDVEVTPDPAVAWRAARAVVPTDLDEGLPLEAAVDGDRTGWVCPATGAVVDVVRAVALAEGILRSAQEPLDGEAYHRAYRRAREAYGAPLPQYLTAEDATARYGVARAAVRQVTYHHLDTDAVRSTVTAEGDEVGGEAVLALDPAWRDSESGESLLVFESGVMWDAATETTVDVVTLAALEADDLPVVDPTQAWPDGVYTDAYRRARTEYRAPLPRWAPGRPDDHIPLLPPAESLVEDPRDRDDEDALQQARDEVGALYRDLVDDGETPSVLQVLPALGKTTHAIKRARERPTSYLAPRKELQKQATEIADAYDVSYRHLPVLGGRVRDEVLAAAVRDVRESDEGQDRLRDRWSIFAAADDGEGVLVDEEDEQDEETDAVDLDRPTCGCATGEHGEDWALAVHVARALDYTPRDIHTRDQALFGATIPCQETGPCDYTEGWDDVRDPENPVDLLIGHYVHANLESVRTHYTQQEGGGVRRRPRAVVIDEFPGLDTYAEDFDDDAFQHIRWIAEALRDDVQDLRDVYERDMWTDEYVRAWLEAEADELPAVARVCGALSARDRLLDAGEAADRLVDTLDAADLDDEGVYDSLRALANADTGDTDDLEDHRDTLRRALANADARPDDAVPLPRWALGALRVDVLGPLESALDDGLDEDPGDLEDLPVGEELRTLVANATEAAAEGRDGARGLLQAAATALRGGDDGARELAVWSDDGYAHRLAHHLLRGAITPTTGEESEAVDGLATRLQTEGFDFTPDSGGDGTTLDCVRHERTTTLVDRNERGAVVYSPPSRTAGNGDPAPFVGLDATARRPLWSLVLGEDVRTHDIHETPRHRRQFLREVHGLQILQIGDEARAYEGDPGGKDLDGDAALLRELKERFTGVRATRDRDGTPTQVGRPACITTKGVRQVLEDREDLEDVVAGWDNYGNVTGDNDLGEHTLAAILGTQHYGDGAVEYLAALGGEEVRRAGYGMALDYGSDLANAYLKHMREDQLLQAALRFTRGDSGALVVCRTAAVRDDLPVVGEGQVATTWSETATELAKAWRRDEGATFTVGDLAEDVDVSGRHVRRTLAELADAGYLRRVREGDGVATEYQPTGPTPEPAEYDLPQGEAPGRSAHKVSYTANVRVREAGGRLDGPTGRVGSVLPAPAPATEGDPPD
jgi:DNA-binding transcriptional ArsR family regulator